MDQKWTISAAQSLVVLSQNGNPEPLTVYNAGPSDALLTQDEAATSPGFPLPVGASIVWDAGRPLCATVPVGTTELDTLTNSGALLTPETFAQALILSNFAQEVADNIAVSGAPPINAFTTLVNLVVGAAGGSSATVDVSAYQSLDIVVLDTSSVGNTFALPRQIFLAWDNNLSDVFYSIDANALIVTPTTSGGVTHISVPVRSPNLFVAVGAGRAGDTVQVLVQGSYKSLGNPTYACGSPYGGPSTGLGTISGSFFERYVAIDFGAQAVGTGNSYPDIIAGLAMVSYRIQTPAGSTVAFRIVDAITNTGRLLDVSAPASTITEGVVQIVVPNRPLRIISTVAGAPASSVGLVIAYGGSP